MTGRDRLAALSAMLAIVSACEDGGGPSGPGEPGEGDAVAWFNGLGYTVDTYFPEDGTLIHNAFVTGELPNDISALGGGLFLTVNSGPSDVTVFDLEGEGPVATIELPAGSNPWSAHAYGDELFVSLMLTDQVAVVDMNSWEIVRWIDAGPNPCGVAVAGGRLFVSHGNWPQAGFGGVTVFDPSSGDSLDHVETPENTYGLRLHPSTGMLHAASSTYLDDGAISIIDPSSCEVTATVSTGGSPVLGDLTSEGFTAGDGYSSGNLFTYQEDGTFSEHDTGHCVNGLVVSGDTLYMTCFPEDVVYLWSLSGQETVGSLQAGDGPQGVAIITR